MPISQKVCKKWGQEVLFHIDLVTPAKVKVNENGLK